MLTPTVQPIVHAGPSPYAPTTLAGPIVKSSPTTTTRAL